MTHSVSQVEHLDLPPQALWNRILAEPDRAPEHIALAAAKRFGPAAAYWARVAGPGKTPPKLAKTAVTKHVRLARLEGATLGWGGAVTAGARPRGAALDPEPDGLLRRGRARP